MLTLEVTSGPAAGQSVELGDELVIGREDAGLVIDDPEISRRHARLSPVDGGVKVEDLGSTNGTFVNGERASEPVTLKESATIRVGTTEIAVNIPIVAVADATRVREISDFEPDVTRAREVPDFDPDVTRARPIASEVPTDLTAPRAVAPTEPPPEAALPPAAAPPAAASTSGIPPVVIALAGGLIVAIVVVVLIALVL
jgi:hypothetical protein